MELSNTINETNSCITEINKSQQIIIVDENGNETDLLLKYITQNDEKIIYGWCQTKTE